MGDFSALRDLVLLEEFKRHLSDRVVTYLNEQKVESLSKAAVMAEEFSLTHKTVFAGHVVSKTQSDARKTQSVRSTPVTHADVVSRSPPQTNLSCFYCHKVGHVIAECPVVKLKTD